MNPELYNIEIEIRERVMYWAGVVERAKTEKQREIYTGIFEMWVRVYLPLSLLNRGE